MIDFPPLPPHVEQKQFSAWNSEKHCKAWLLDIFKSAVDAYAIAEPNLVDIYGNRARADIGILVKRGNQDCFFAVELKHQANISANAAAAYAQAYHYRDMCIVNDDRLPWTVRDKSPSLAFAGVFEMQGDRWHVDSAIRHHEDRWFGMDILSTLFKVGSVRYYQKRDEVSFHFGEARIFGIRLSTGEVTWHAAADSYIFGSEKRNGSRRDRQSVAERFVEIQTPRELF